MQRQHWFHCTQRARGAAFVAELRAPDLTGTNEPEVPRLCVCPHVYQCFAARLFMEQPVYVYRTAVPRRAIKAVGVWDSFLTDEHWLVSPAPMTLVRTIGTDVVEKIQGDMRAFHEWTQQHSDHRLKIAQLLLAARTLDEGEYNRLLPMNKYLGGLDPVKFIYQRIAKAIGAEAEA